MEMVNSVENADKLRILKMVYTNLVEITFDTVTYTDEEYTYIANLDGDTLIKRKKNEIAIFGSFYIYVDDNNNVAVVSAYTGKRKIYTSSWDDASYFDMIKSNTQNIGDKFLWLPEHEKGHLRADTEFILYNIYFEEQYKLKEWGIPRSIILDYKSSVTTTWCKYSANFNYRLMKLNNETNKVEIFDTLTIEGAELTYDLVSTDWCKDGKGYSINKSVDDNLKYSLSTNGVIVSKSYQDIFRAPELFGTCYLFTYEMQESVKKGVIRTDGVELLPPLYDDLNYIGNNNFVITYGNFRKVFNIYKGDITDWINKPYITIHETLPIVLIYDKGQYMILDNKNRYFKIEELTRYFECDYNIGDPSILRVKVDTGLYKIVDNRLGSITNLNQIKTLNNIGWNHIG